MENYQNSYCIIYNIILRKVPFSSGCTIAFWSNETYFVPLKLLCEDISQGRIQKIFEISNRFWAHKNQRPNFDRSAKDVILILFNSC